MYKEDDLQLLSFVAANLAIVLQQRKLIDKERADRQSLEGSLQLIKEQNLALENMMETLKGAQNELVQKEKMASLGNLVAGIAHEINTPIGICVTAITNLHHQYKSLQKQITDNTASDKHLNYFLEDVDEACTIIESNTLRAAELINSFKEIAVDQSSEASREINMKEYIAEILLAMRPILKKTPHEVLVTCPENLVVKTIPGAISQILTNMINNSIIHGFNDGEKGCLTITVVKENDGFGLCYQDNGKGLNNDEIKMLFEPFYTTKRGLGGSGLGAHLIYNIVTSSLHGKISVESEPGKGLRYNLFFPLEAL
jgi:signal transduction histidine kinase